MGFGVISNTLLITIAVTPAAASAGVHVAETFTSAAEGASHICQRNVDWHLFGRPSHSRCGRGYSRRLRPYAG